MRIVVNDIAASRGGAITVLKRFYNYIRNNDNENEWYFLLGDNYLEETDRIHILCLPEIKKSHIKKVIFDCFTGRKVVEDLCPDVVVSLQNVITFGVHKPQILYVHQSIPFQTVKKFSFFKANERSMAVVQYLIGAFIKQSIKKADKVFVQTKWMKQAVEKYIKQKDKPVYCAFPDVEQFEPDTSKYTTNRFFYPTTTGSYKNNDLIIKACDMLVADGINDFEVRLTLPQGTINHKNIKCIGCLDRIEMQEEYRSGTLLFPSYIETVGLPLLEARSCQTMILASDTPFSHECLENYENAYFYSPFDAIALKECMNAVITGVYALEKVNECTIDRPSWNEFYKEIISSNNSFIK